MTNDTEEIQRNNKEASTLLDKVISGIIIVGSILIGRFVGLLGLVAIAFGWFIYNGAKIKLGRFIAIFIGTIGGLAAYGLTAIVIIDLIG